MFIYMLAFGLLTLETEASIASDCMRLLLDEEFHVPCADVPSTSRKPCLVSSIEDHEYLKRFGIVSAPGGPTGQMICAPHGELDNMDCVSTKFRSNKKIDWMWTEWERFASGMMSRTMYYVDNGAVKHCPYQETIPIPSIVLKYSIDDSGAIYADGMLIDDTVRWGTLTTLTIPALTHLLAFKVVNGGGPTGVVASLSTGVRTDTSASWKCSLVYEEGWNQLGFDDTHWGSVNNQGGDFTSLGVDYGAMRINCRSNAASSFYFRRILT